MDRYIIELAIFLVIIALVEMIIPTSSHGKYIKLVVGFIIMSYFLKPISDLSNDFFDFSFDYDYDNSEYNKSIEELSYESQKNFTSMSIKVDISRLIETNSTFKVNDVQVVFYDDIEVEKILINVDFIGDLTETNYETEKNKIEKIIFNEYYFITENINIVNDNNT
ncbi:MAG: stage III sporulation protein AF [Lachnospirales bacterium]